MAQIKQNRCNFWLFADNLTEEGTILEYCDFVEIDAKNKNGKIPCFIFLGQVGEKIGEFKLAKWNIANLNDVIKELGDNSDDWKGKFFKVTGGKGKPICLFQTTMPEEKV